MIMIDLQPTEVDGVAATRLKYRDACLDFDLLYMISSIHAFSRDAILLRMQELRIEMASVRSDLVISETFQII